MVRCVSKAVFVQLLRPPLVESRQTVSRIVVGEFPARTFEELFQGVFALDWENYLPLGAKFPISKAKCVKSKLHNEPSVSNFKKAVVKKLQKYFHRPEGVPLQETGAEFKIEVSILKDKATVLIDTTGASLFKRGYRTDKGGAPIKENMAAAILELSNWYPDKPLIDPTCGSGTFCIEAAMIGMNIAPGFNRDFAFEAWNWVDKDLVQLVRDEADSKANYDVELDIMGCDIDGRMVEIAKANAREAGLEDVIKLKQMRLQDLKQIKSMVSLFQTLLMVSVCWMTRLWISCIMKWVKLLRHLKLGASLS